MVTAVRTDAPLGSEPTSAMVDVRGLRKQFGDLTAVDGVSFRVEPGEVFGILGPNGAGKTTTLEIVETLQRPTAGDVFVAGFDALREPEQVKARIGVQLQSASFYPDLSLVDLLKLFAALYDVPVDPMAMLRRFQLEEKAKVAIDKLSGGQRQRFSLATTLLNRPDVIFLDEPTTGLDPQARLNLWDLIRDVQSGGTTVVLTTHYMEEAEQLCDRVAIMDRGLIIRIGSPRSLIDELLATGFRKEVVRQEASLEDVFIHFTGRSLRDGG